MVRKKLRIWLNAPKHEETSQRRPLHIICPKPPTVKLQQFSLPVSYTKRSCTTQKVLTPKQIKLFSK